MSEVTYRIGSPPTRADAKRQKPKAEIHWLDFALGTLCELVGFIALVLILTTPVITGHR